MLSIREFKLSREKLKAIDIHCGYFEEKSISHDRLKIKYRHSYQATFYSCLIIIQQSIIMHIVKQ